MRKRASEDEKKEEGGHLTLMAPSHDPETIFSSSNCKQVTDPVWPSRVRKSLPMGRHHTLRLPSPLLVG
jgi:hypothetical protein